MQPWFTWKGKNSFSDFGLWIKALPPIVRAKERTTQIQIPGRTGSVTMTEGDDVYDSVVRKCTVLARNSMSLQGILEWLRGSGEVTFSNEPEYVYFARIAAEVSFSRISNDLCQAQVVFDCQPLKSKQNIDDDQVTVTGSSTIYNPGDVSSRPLIYVIGTGANVTVTIGDDSMTFNNLSGTINVDCDARIIIQSGTLWSGTFTGEFLTIPCGQNTISVSGGTMIIQPRWRWV